MLLLRAVPISLYRTETSSCFRLLCISVLEPQGVEGCHFWLSLLRQFFKPH